MPATYDSLATTTLGAGTTSFNLSSIPSGYTDLRLIIVTTFSNASELYVRFNSDSGTTYSQTTLSGHANFGATSTSRSSNTQIQFSAGTAETTSSTIPTLYTVDIFSYSGSTFKSVITRSFCEKGSSSSSVQTTIGLWSSTSAINTINIINAGSPGNINAGTTATLYGILKA